jgi:hypothetical protein
MTGLTEYITTAPWADTILLWYVLVDDAYQQLERQHGSWRRRGPTPAFSDSEVITVALIIDTLFHGNEELGLAFIRQYQAALFPALLPNGQFNDRRRALGLLTEQLRQTILRTHGLVAPTDRLRVIDSAPIPVRTYQRGSATAVVSGAEYCGIAKSQGAKIYGFRLVLTTTSEQVVDRWLLAPASLHDSQTMEGLLLEYEDMLILGDGAYHNPSLTERLAKRRVEVLSPPRKDNRSRTPWPAALRAVVGKLRRRVETALSVLSTVFHLKVPGAHSQEGVIARISSRILAHTLSFLMGSRLAQLAA